MAITPAGPWVLTAEDGGQSRLGRYWKQGPRERSARPEPGADRALLEGRLDGQLEARLEESGCKDLKGSGWKDTVPGDPRIRASDADRDRATALLREHHAAGRLTAEEFDERMTAALDAKTLGELDELMADLPAIDLYRLPDESLRRAPPHASLLPRDPGGRSPAGLTPARWPWGPGPRWRGALIAVWAVTAVIGGRDLVPVVALVVIPWIWVAIRRAQARRKARE